jgi:hypothetical protein
MVYADRNRNVLQLFGVGEVSLRTGIGEEDASRLGAKRYSMLLRLAESNHANKFLQQSDVRGGTNKSDALRDLVDEYALKFTLNHLYKNFGFWENGSPRLPEKLEYATGRALEKYGKSRVVSWNDRLSKKEASARNPYFYIAKIAIKMTDGSYAPVYGDIFDFEMPADKVPIRISVRR